MNSFSSSTLLSLQRTPYGGRGLFATRSIPKGTLIHTCPEPYALVIYRDFRKEVCAHCFKYSFQSGLHAWKTRAEDGLGLWFCSDWCKDERTERCPEGRKQINKAIDSKPNKAVGASELAIDFKLSANVVWKAAEGWVGKQVPELTPTELDIARFAASAILQRYVEDNNDVPSAWQDLLTVQDNESAAYEAHPHLLQTHVLVYLFLKRTLPACFKPYLDSSETVRALFAREQGNAFGIWEHTSLGEDEDMFGFAIYVSASFFNHDCAPNTSKVRNGRALEFYTTREVEVGEELCIGYVPLGESGEERRERLRENWFFGCACQRCGAESG